MDRISVCHDLLLSEIYKYEPMLKRGAIFAHIVMKIWLKLGYFTTEQQKIAAQITSTNQQSAVQGQIMRKFVPEELAKIFFLD